MDTKAFTDDALDVINSFAERDEEKSCRWCIKNEWGADKHEPDCPFGKLYKFLLKYSTMGRR